jgi:hypothetical protein
MLWTDGSQKSKNRRFSPLIDNSSKIKEWILTLDRQLPKIKEPILALDRQLPKIKEPILTLDQQFSKNQRTDSNPNNI